MKHKSKYMPHQGKRECARRVKQMEKQKERFLKAMHKSIPHNDGGDSVQ